MSDVIIGILGLVISLVGLGFGYAGWRAKQLRSDEILSWSAECIDVLQRTKLTLGDAARGTPVDDFGKLMADLRIRSSVLVERGRLFFRNVEHPYGAEKQPAYRGLRPKILDCLVANCQICEIAPSCGQADLRTLDQVSLKYVTRFVSFAQAEVGRSRQSKSRANEAGQETDVRAEMASLPNGRAEDALPDGPALTATPRRG